MLTCTTVLLGTYLSVRLANAHSEYAHTVYKYARIGFSFGCGCPAQSKHQADNLAKLWQEFLSVTELIAKIFGAVSRTTSLMRLSALLASKRCRCRNDGFCSGARAIIVHYSLLIINCRQMPLLLFCLTHLFVLFIMFKHLYIYMCAQNTK